MRRSRLKVILIGDRSVGKTSLRNRFMGKGFKSSYLMTIGADFSIKREGDKLLQIWDLAGQDSFREIRKNYYLGTDGALLVFDVLSKISYSNIQKWLDEILQNHGKMVPTIILANKFDLLELRDSAVTEGELLDLRLTLADRYKFDFPVIYTSALTGFNVDNAFAELVNTINHSQIVEEL